MATPYEGQLVLLALYRQSFAVDPTIIETTVRQLLQLEGDIFAFKKETEVNAGTLRATIEFSDTTTALDAMSKYRNGMTIDVGDAVHKAMLSSTVPITDTCRVFTSSYRSTRKSLSLVPPTHLMGS